MTEMTSLKKRMTKRGKYRSPETSSTEHLFPAISGSQSDVKEVEVPWDCDVSRIGKETEMTGKDRLYSVRDLGSDTEYAVRVRYCVEKRINGRWREEAIEKTQRLSAPSNVSVNSETWDSITFTWDPVDGTSFYQVEVDESEFWNAFTTNTFTKRRSSSRDRTYLQSSCCEREFSGMWTQWF